LPVRTLSGFQRFSLPPGEKKEVRFELGAEAFAFWNDQNKFVVEPARLTMWISPDSTSGEGTTLAIAP
jgi:beta-glucosidase